MEKVMSYIIRLSFAIILCFFIAFPFMWLWNGAIVVAISAANHINYWTAFCSVVFIMIVCGPPVRN